jgi:hypothetical protein
VRGETEEEEEEGKNGDQNSQNEPKTTTKVEPINHQLPKTIRAASAPMSVAVTALTMQIMQTLVPVDQSGWNGTETTSTNKVSSLKCSTNNNIIAKKPPANFPRNRSR